MAFFNFLPERSPWFLFLFPKFKYEWAYDKALFITNAKILPIFILMIMFASILGNIYVFSAMQCLKVPLIILYLRFIHNKKLKNPYLIRFLIQTWVFFDVFSLDNDYSIKVTNVALLLIAYFTFLNWLLSFVFIGFHWLCFYYINQNIDSNEIFTCFIIDFMIILLVDIRIRAFGTKQLKLEGKSIQLKGSFSI